MVQPNTSADIVRIFHVQNQFDSIDFSDNAIVRLEGFPKLPRMNSLHVNNNRIIRIGRGLEDALPRLEWLILNNNKIKNLGDLEPLASFPRLKYLSLLDNPVTKQPGYRLFVIDRCKRLKMLDFRKIKNHEREEAHRRFGGKLAPSASVEEDSKMEAGKEIEEPKEPSARKGPTPEQITAIKSAIAAASTLEEVRRLEDALKSGHMPSDLRTQDGSAVPQSMEEG